MTDFVPDIKNNISLLYKFFRKNNCEIKNIVQGDNYITVSFVPDVQIKKEKTISLSNNEEYLRNAFISKDYVTIDYPSEISESVNNIYSYWEILLESVNKEKYKNSQEQKRDELSL